jgi:hypothetical protein
LLKFIEAREAREARREELKLKKQSDGSVEIDWDLAFGCSESLLRL